MSELTLVLIAIITLLLWSFFADAPLDRDHRRHERQDERPARRLNSLL
ncbi:MAG: hypothetical protein K1X65_12695 [Caldilineales bacterium]|nr:hypothetical protein [Caldilineales bacterium]MCW5860567.1 hypothetical protein [Caldilineales bacterium]